MPGGRRMRGLGRISLFLRALAPAQERPCEAD